MANEKIHPVEEFGQFPYDKLIFRKGHSSNWSYGFGGHYLPDDTGIIMIVADDLSAEIWILPEAISYMIKMHARCEVEDLRRKLRSLLGVK